MYHEHHTAPVPTAAGTRDPPLAHASCLTGGQLVGARGRPATLHLRADLPLRRPAGLTYASVIRLTYMVVIGRLNVLLSAT